MWGRKKKPDIVIINCGLNCPENNRCKKWVILSKHIPDGQGGFRDEADGRCSEAWIPQLLIELRNEITMLRKEIHNAPTS